MLIQLPCDMLKEENTNCMGGETMSFTFVTLRQSYLEARKLILFSSLQGRDSSLRKRESLSVFDSLP